MGLFSFLHKNKQDANPGNSEYRSQSDEPFTDARPRPKRSNGKEADDDPILPEKKRARRRLIGAVVLVLAVVIVLPMILDPEPKPLTDDIAVQIPSRDSKDNKDSKDKASTAPVISASGKQSDAASLSASEELVENKPAEKAVEKVADKAAEKPVLKVADTPVEKPAEKVAVIEKPVEKSIEKPAEKPAAAPVKAAPPPVAKPADKPAPAKPTEEQRALAILHADKAPANAAKPGEKPGDKSATPAVKPTGKFVIQVAALATQEKIDELRNKLKTAGITSYTQKVATQDGDRTRIRVGPFAHYDEAEKMRVKIIKLGLNATMLPT